MQNQTVIIVLTLLMNTLGGITAASLFKPGSVAFLVVSIAGLVVGNALAIFGRPMAAKTASWTVEEPKVILPGELGKFVFLLFVGAALVSGCSTAGGKAFTACELGKLPSEAQVAWATVQDIVSAPDSTTDALTSAALALAPGQLDCAARALLAWLEGLSEPAVATNPLRHAKMATSSHDHQRAVLKAYLAGKATSCRPVRVALLETCTDACRPVVVDDDVPTSLR